MSAAPGGPYVGHFVPWDGGCLFIGVGGGLVPVHAHYSVQVAFGETGEIRFRAREDAPWAGYAGAIIPSRQPHGMDAREAQPCAVVFVEPETPQGRAISERWLRDGIAGMPSDVLATHAPPVFAAWREGGAGAVARAAQELVRALAGGVPPLHPVDERIVRATTYIRTHLDAPLTLEDVADVACLSPSRFRHLFVEQTGMALRPYILWRRFLRAWEVLMDGATLSAAAHAAGFADAAHLSRTSRTVFGIPPSAMQMAGPLRGPPEVSPFVQGGSRSVQETTTPRR